MNSSLKVSWTTSDKYWFWTTLPMNLTVLLLTNSAIGGRPIQHLSTYARQSSQKDNLKIFLTTTSNTNYLPPILHRFWDIAFDRSEIDLFYYPSCLNPTVEGFPWDDLRKIFCGCQWMATVPNAVEILLKVWTTWVVCSGVRALQTRDDRQTDG